MVNPKLPAISLLLQTGDALCAYPDPKAPSISRTKAATFTTSFLFINPPHSLFSCFPQHAPVSLRSNCRSVCTLIAGPESGQLTRPNSSLTCKEKVAKGVIEFPELKSWGKIRFLGWRLMDALASSSRRVRTGLFEIDFGSGEVHKEGRKVQLQEQPFRVLAILLERPGEVVTREQLQARLWSADTYVGFDEGLNTAIRKLRVAFGDSAENPRFIETVSRRGYRFIAPVEAELIPSLSPPARTPAAKSRVVSRRMRWIGFAAIVFVILALIVFLRTAGPRKPRLGKIMLVVLPLENFTGDSQQDYLADGITEEIIAQLRSE